jgi:hypothetical protein
VIHARRFAAICLFLAPVAACGEKPRADRPAATIPVERPPPANSLAITSAPPSATTPPAPPNDPVPQTLTATGAPCTSDKECTLLYEPGGCCSCGYVLPLTVQSLHERARESLPSRHCELAQCAKPQCNGPGIEDFRPLCINHSCGTVRR